MAGQIVITNYCSPLSATNLRLNWSAEKEESEAEAEGEGGDQQDQLSCHHSVIKEGWRSWGIIC